MRNKRHYKAEYQRRIANAAKQGLSRSQARGHAKAGEAPIRAHNTKAKSDDRLEAALKLLHRTGSQQKAAKEAGVSPERLRRFIRSNNLAKRSGRNWQITDGRQREMMVLTDGRREMLTLSGFEAASLNGRHLAAVHAFLSSNDPDYLQPFVGRSITDASGVDHVFETNPNRLYEIDAEGEVFEQIYRLVI